MRKQRRRAPKGTTEGQFRIDTSNKLAEVRELIHELMSTADFISENFWEAVSLLKADAQAASVVFKNDEKEAAP